MNALATKLLVLATLLTAAAGKPSIFNVPNTMDISAVLNKTMCPIVVDFDTDAERIPKTIKIFKCGNDPQEHCREKNVPHYECCEHGHGDVRMSCAEIQDVVQVYYPAQPAGARHQHLRVSVGCACVMEAVAPLSEQPPA